MKQESNQQGQVPGILVLAPYDKIEQLAAERDAQQMEMQACMGLLEDVPGECLGDRVHKMVVDYIALLAERDALRGALARIAQGGNTVHSIYPNTGPKSRDEMATIAVRALASISSGD